MLANAECRMQSEELRNAECGMRNAEEFVGLLLNIYRNGCWVLRRGLAK
jgi:hypothetical protein